MATKRRKAQRKRGLGDTQDAHVSWATAAALAALDSLGEAETALEEGDCGMALFRAARAYSSVAIAGSQLQSAKLVGADTYESKFAREKFKRAADRAEKFLFGEEFASKCMKGRG